MGKLLPENLVPILQASKAKDVKGPTGTTASLANEGKVWRPATPEPLELKVKGFGWFRKVLGAKRGEKGNIMRDFFLKKCAIVVFLRDFFLASSKNEDVLCCVCK